MGNIVLSLFDGIACGKLALQRAGIKTDAYYASEVDKYAIQTAVKNHPDIIEIGDVRKISYENGILHTENGDYPVPKIDLLIGGSPCQSFTFSGKREGMRTTDKKDILTLDEYLAYKDAGYKFDGQSYLFWEYVRILQQLKPEFFLLENVKMKQCWQEVITSAVGVQPVRINSNLFSAQNRDRLYWTNINMGYIPLPAGNDTVLRDIVEEKYDIPKYALSATHHSAFLKSYPWKSSSFDGKSKPLLATYYKQPPHCPYIPSSVSDSGYRRLSPEECEKLQTLPVGYTEGVSDTQRYKCIGNGWTVDVVAYILSFFD